MRVLKQEVIANIERHEPIRLDLGSGGQGKEGCLSVDHIELPGVDIVADLNEPLHLLPDDSVEYVYSRHVMEHVANYLGLMGEIHRVVRKDGLVEIIVPHFSNVFGYSDPTHVRFFGLYSMYYFSPQHLQPCVRQVPSYYGNRHFTVESVRICLYRISAFDKLVARMLEKLVNLNIHTQIFYERRLAHLFHAAELVYRMRPIK